MLLINMVSRTECCVYINRLMCQAMWSGHNAASELISIIANDHPIMI